MRTTPTLEWRGTCGRALSFRSLAILWTSWTSIKPVGCSNGRRANFSFRFCFLNNNKSARLDLPSPSLPTYLPTTTSSSLLLLLLLFIRPDGLICNGSRYERWRWIPRRGTLPVFREGDDHIACEMQMSHEGEGESGRVV